jgi:hypothetical protein
MRRVLYKLFWAWNVEAEEAWLTGQSARGLQLTHVGLGRYVFEEQPGEAYCYRLEFLEEVPTHPKSVAYLRFLEEMGIECAATYLRWVYLRRKASVGAFELFSDLDSRLAHWRRIGRTLLIIGGINLLFGLLYLPAALRSAYRVMIFAVSLNLGAALLLGFGTLSIRRKMLRFLRERRIRE